VPRAGSASQTPTPTPRDAGLRVIIAYKLVRAGLSLLGGVGLVAVALAGRAEAFQVWAEALHDHAVSGLALTATSLLVSAVQPRHVLPLGGALLLDAAVLLLEGLALLRGHRWGVWLVVGASAALLPFELVALARHPAAGRWVLLGANLVVVGWLVRGAARRSA
jgi:uncharacterized membrane protein (DUF2068 family)